MEHPPTDPHGPIEQLFDDAFWVRGSIRLGPGMSINRNMVVLRHDGALTLINPVRLDEEGEAALLALGKIKHAMRIGYFHGKDDGYYVERHKTTFWCQKGSNNFDGPAPSHVIEDGGELPIPGARFIAFRETKNPECTIHIERDGGMLIACDSVQHHVDTVNCSFLAKPFMYVAGFMRPMNIGPFWRKYMTKEGGSIKPDFDRLLELDFEYAIGAHGSACMSGARDGLAQTVRHVYA